MGQTCCNGGSDNKHDHIPDNAQVGVPAQQTVNGTPNSNSEEEVKNKAIVKLQAAFRG